MIYTEKIKRASYLCTSGYRGKVDKGWMPYIFHPLHLAEHLYFEDEIIVAMLHDYIEENPECLDRVMEADFGEEINTALLVISRNSKLNEGRSYQEYIEAVAKNSLATRVKILDLQHNLNLSRTNGQATDSLVKRYCRALRYLIEHRPVSIIPEALPADGSHIGASVDTPYYSIGVDGILAITPEVGHRLVKSGSAVTNLTLYLLIKDGSDRVFKRRFRYGSFRLADSTGDKYRVIPIKFDIENAIPHRKILITAELDTNCSKITKIVLDDAVNLSDQFFKRKENEHWLSGEQ